MPAASNDMDADEAVSAAVRSTRGTTTVYIGTPDRPRIDKRRPDPEEMDEDVNKVRKFNSKTEEGKVCRSQDHPTMNQTPNYENLQMPMMTCCIAWTKWTVRF